MSTVFFFLVFWTLYSLWDSNWGFFSAVTKVNTHLLLMFGPWKSRQWKREGAEGSSLICKSHANPVLLTSPLTSLPTPKQWQRKWKPMTTTTKKYWQHKVSLKKWQTWRKKSEDWYWRTNDAKNYTFLIID